MTEKAFIKYIAMYDSADNRADNRNMSYAGAGKVDYICSALNKTGHTVTIISPSWTQNPKGFYAGKKVRLSIDTSLKLFSTFGAKARAFKQVKIVFTCLQFFLYLLFSLKRSDTLLVYHSPAYASLIRFIKAVRHVCLVLEVEEIYADVSLNEHMRRKEQKIFDVADKYIFSTELLNEKINKKNKPFSIVYGAYAIEEKLSSVFPDDKIHAVYAGTFDERKGGSLLAMQAAALLDNRYQVHILGFGTPQQVERVKKMVDDVSLKGGPITFEGLLHGSEYKKFLQSCQIGLSTQTSDGGYNDTSFPSKVLSYLSNGLKVVSADIPVLKRSRLCENISFYSGNSPKAVADAIMSVDLFKKDSTALLKTLDKEFCADIESLLKK